MTTDQLTAETIAQQRDQFVDRFLQSAAGAFNIFTIYLGDRLGLYRPLAEDGPLTSAELATRTGTQERYVREWLEQQTVAGILEVEDESRDAKARRFRLPPGHAEPLIDCSSLNYLAPLAQLIAGAVRPLDDLVNAYRRGGGVPFSAYGADLREGQAAMNCSAFTQQLTREWLPAIPEVHARLQADPPARVADIGCGHGWSSIGVAQGYPKVRVDGFDLDGPSIDRARQNARSWRLSDRVQFHVRDAGDPALAGQYDLAMALECVHDMSDPIGALRSMRRLVSERGTILIVDERVGDTFTSKGNEVEWLMYGFSVLHCLPSGMTEPHSAGTGTVMRADTLLGYAAEAGFTRFKVLPIDNFFFRFYQLNA